VAAEAAGQMIRIRGRVAGDVGLCVEVLAEVHRASGYPVNWPDDPAGWITPAGMTCAWVASTDAVPVAGHLVLRQVADRPAGQPAAEVSRLFVAPAARRQGVAQALLGQAMQWAAANEQDLVLEVTDHLKAARALYDRAGFRRLGTKLADWTTPGGQPVVLHQYRWSSLPKERSGAG
jgi:ribosomal protein S18 acetylase RimI-like enzyme